MNASDALDQYRNKRNFDKTREPAGDEQHAGDAPVFVVQKHDASTLHYDFRLELDGVLKSWVVPKGPSPDPAHRRLAIRVEDHPLAYAQFQGEIPPGEYGAGTVERWDYGTWEPMKDPGEGLDSGKLEFRLFGKKLRGAWVLIRMDKKPDEDQENWLLIKMKDAFAKA